jgi:parallel beta-helix repeat protein
VRKSAILLVLLLLVSVILISFSQIGVAQAEGTIYIRADGSVEGTDKIQRDGNVYTFTGDIYGPIVVEKDDVVVDGAGYILQGNGSGYGIHLIHRSYVTVRKMEIKEFDTGIRVYEGSNNTIRENVIAHNECGIDLYYSENNIISGNIITENNDGVSVWGSGTYAGNVDSGFNDITWNNITNNNKGIYFERSGINTVHHNNFVNNIKDWWDYGCTPWKFQLPLSENIWDDGNEGNYWDTYDGTDNNSDGIGDEPHVLYENNQDNHPLMEPTIIPEFPSWIILPLLLTATLVIMVCKRKLTENR